MSVLGQTSNLTKAKLSSQEPDRLIVESVLHPSAIQFGFLASEAIYRNLPGVPFALSQDVKTQGHQLNQQFGTPTPAVKDDRGLSFRPQQLTYLTQQNGQHATKGSIGLGRDDKQGITSLIVHPIIGGCRSGQSCSCHIGFGNGVFAMLSTNMAVDVKKTEHLATFLDALPCQFLCQLVTSFFGGQLGQFTA